MKNLLSFKLIICIFLFTSLSTAQISPGKLSLYHENLEGLSNCTKCHELGEEPTSEKCFSCHTAIELRINANQGYHGSDKVRLAKCIDCHSEHNGREFELIHWKEGIENFKHEHTGYKIEGNHQGIDCRKCHLKAFISDDNISYDKSVDRNRTFLGLNQDCVNCHVDEHSDQLKDACLDCHNYEGWKQAVKFNHDSARYKLTGLHQDLNCSKCHPMQTIQRKNDYKIDKSDNQDQTIKFTNLEFQNCTPCHQDVHLGKFGDICSQCHTTKGFKTSGEGKFNHDLTGFPLAGQHKNVVCAKCHSSGRMTDQVTHEKCTDCHSDYHQGQFADRPDNGACESCHSVEGFIPSNYTIEMHLESKFALTGGHLAIPCDQCHKQIVNEQKITYSQYDFIDFSCSGCHEDIHNGQVDDWLLEGGCEYCHNTESWRIVNFNHDLSSFKLEGKHTNTACDECHYIEDKEQIVIKPLKQNCFDCHEDIHYGQFQTQSSTQTECSRCHNPSSWKDLNFDHNRDTRFKLEGAHIRLECGKCHMKLSNPEGGIYTHYKPLGIECKDCHFSEENTDSLNIRQD